MTNCREEFIEAVGSRELLCATVVRRDYAEDEITNEANLPIGFTYREYAEFLNQIDYSYDSGFGFQEVFGIIWYKDGTYSDRYEYDGVEWWEYIICPAIPEYLKPAPAR